MPKACAIKVVKEEKKKGIVAKYYKASFPATVIELPFGHEKIGRHLAVSIDNKCCIS